MLKTFYREQGQENHPKWSGSCSLVRGYLTLDRHSYGLPNQENLLHAKGLTPRVQLPLTPPTWEQHSFIPCLCLEWPSSHSQQHHPRSFSLNKGNFPMRRKKTNTTVTTSINGCQNWPTVCEGPNQFDLWKLSKLSSRFGTSTAQEKGFNYTASAH